MLEDELKIRKEEGEKLLDKVLELADRFTIENPHGCIEQGYNYGVEELQEEIRYLKDNYLKRYGKNETFK